MPKRRQKFGQKIKRAAVIGAIALGAGAVGTGIAAKAGFKPAKEAIRTVENAGSAFVEGVKEPIVKAAKETGKRAAGGAAGAAAGYMLTAGARGWRKRRGTERQIKVGTITGAVGGAVFPGAGVVAAGVTAVGKENWKKVGRWSRDIFKELGKDKRPPKTTRTEEKRLAVRQKRPVRN